MSNPRNQLSFNEIRAHLVTCNSSGISAADIVVGTPGPAVSLLSNGTVSKGTAADRLFGQVQVYNVVDGYVSVQDTGYATFTYTGTAPTVSHSVECHGDGTVQVATANNVDRGNTVISVDTTNHLVTVKLS